MLITFKSAIFDPQKVSSVGSGIYTDMNDLTRHELYMIVEGHKVVVMTNRTSRFITEVKKDLTNKINDYLKEMK